MFHFAKQNRLRYISLFVTFSIFIILSLACASVQIEGEEKTVVESTYPKDDVVVTVVANRRPIDSWEGENAGKVESFDVTVENHTDKQIKVVFDESNVYGQVPFLLGRQTYQQLGAVPRPISISPGFNSKFNMTSSMQWYYDTWVLNGQVGGGWFTRPLELNAFMTLYIEIGEEHYKWNIFSGFIKDEEKSANSDSEQKTASAE